MTHAEQRTRLLEATRTLLGSLAHTAPETEILQAGIQALTELMQVTYGAICLLDEHGQQSRFVHTDAGLEDRDHADHPLRCHGLLGALSLHDSSLCGNDMPRLYPQLSSLLAVPISRQGRVYGRLYLSNKIDQQAFSEEDETLATSFADALSLILDNARKLEELTHAHNALSHSAHHDALTNLPNRALLCDRIEQVMCRAVRNQALAAVLFCDLDGFKTINDSMGHQTGDAVLKTIGERLQSCVRGTDTVARIGGDEFVFVLPEIESIEQVGFVAQKVLQALRQQLHIDGHDIQLSGSLGIAIYPFDGKTSEQLIKHADVAMYRAKASGKNHYRYYSAVSAAGNYNPSASIVPTGYGMSIHVPYAAHCLSTQHDHSTGRAVAACLCSDAYCH